MAMKRILLSLLVFGLVFVSCRSEADVGEDDEFGDVDGSDEPAEDDVEPATEEKVDVPKPEYKLPEVMGNAYFTEAFAHPHIPKRWVLSEAKKDETDEDIAKYDGKWSVEEPQDNPMDGDLGLVLKSKARHHAIAAPMDRPYDFSGNPLIVQYEVKFQSGMDCGGSYVKLLQQDPGLDLKNFVDKTPFTIMFGPDKCGTDAKLHFIFQHKNPKTGKYEEKHAKPPTKKFSEAFDDKRTHLFTLVLFPDNKFEIYVDQNLVNSGSLLADFSPAVNPPAEIEDPNDKKPVDWDEREKIPDSDAKKPEDWDETLPEMIPDESAVKPEGWLDDEPDLIPDPSSEKPSDWDDDMDGEWEPAKISNPKCEAAPGCGEWTRPQIKNPLYKGKWRPPMIANPNYKGTWKPKLIANPDFFEDKTPYKMTPFVAIGLELWSMSDNILFDNFIITDDKAVADSWAGKTWLLKNRYETAKAASSGKLNFFQKLYHWTKEKPWMWAVIILAIVLPTLLFIAFCCIKTPHGRIKGGISGFFSMLLDAANDRPWLYAIYLVVVLLPVVVLSIFLCPSKPQIPEAEDDAGERKKTDEATADDVIDEEEEEPEQESDEVAAGAGDAPEVEQTKKKGKSALDAEEEEEENEGEGEIDEEVTRRSSPRKRKQRKD